MDKRRDESESRILNMEEAARMLDISVGRLAAKAEVGRIRSVKREGRNFWFSEAELQTHLKDKRWKNIRLPVYVAAAVITVVFGYGGYRFMKIKQSRIYEKNAAVVMKKKNFKTALTFLHEAVLCDPGNVSARLSYARLLGASGQLDEQEKQLRAALEENPGSVEALQNLGILFMRKKQPDEAEKTFKRILKLEPGHFLSNYQLAMILAGRGNISGARKYINAVLKTRPGFGPGEILLADLFAGESKFSEARQLYAGQSKTSLAALLNQGVITQKNGDFPAASQIYGEVIENSPIIARAYNNLSYGMISGSTIPDKKTLQQAFDMARKAFLLNPGDATISDTLGWILHLAGRDNEALKQLDYAIKLSPSLAEAHFHKASILLKQGDPAAALASFKTARDKITPSSGISKSTVDYFINKIESVKK